MGKFDYDLNDLEDGDYIISENIRLPVIWFDEIM
jgi:hypothetical protein